MNIFITMKTYVYIILLTEGRYDQSVCVVISHQPGALSLPHYLRSDNWDSQSSLVPAQTELASGPLKRSSGPHLGFAPYTDGIQ